MSDPAIAAPAPVLVENLLRRPKEGGTRVDIGGREYHFKPSAEGREFCLVTDQAHLARFLAIPEAYVMIGVVQASAAEVGAGAPALDPAPIPFVTVPAPEAPAPAPQAVNQAAPAATGEADAGSTIIPVVEGETPPPAVVTPEPDKSDADKGPVTPDPDAVPEDLAALDLEQLREVFAKEVGRTPNARAKPETLIAQIVAMREETGAAK